jgi:NADH-quinone oxidoreductase subunit B
MVKVVDAPEGFEGQGFFATSLDTVIGMARANSLWPLPFATSCCGIEFMATMGANYDLARFGSERMSFSPRQADLLIVAGTISKKLGPVLKQVYDQMAEPSGCFQLELVPLVAEYSTHTVYFKALIM